MKWLVVLLLAISFCGCQAKPKADRYALFVFTAPWCQACRQDRPRVNALREAGLEVVEINVQRYPEVAERRGIETIPHYIIFNGSEVVLETGEIARVEKLLGRGVSR